MEFPPTSKVDIEMPVNRIARCSAATCSTAIFVSANHRRRFITYPPLPLDHSYEFMLDRGEMV